MSNVFVATAGGDIIGVADSLDNMFQLISQYFGCEAKDNLTRFRDIRDSGIECDFYLDYEYVCIQDFKINEL